MGKLLGILLGVIFVFIVAGSASANSFLFHDNRINWQNHIVPITTDTNGTPKVGDMKLTYDYSTAEIQVGNEFTTSATAVPEPATMLLFGCGLIGIATVGRKKILNMWT